MAVSFQGLYQDTTVLVQGMSSYIQTLEQNQQVVHQQQQQQLQQQQMTQPQQNGVPYQNQGIFGRRNTGRGVWNTIWTSAQQGAGFEIGRDIVDNIFRIF